MSEHTIPSIKSHPDYVSVVNKSSLKDTRINELEEESKFQQKQIDQDREQLYNNQEQIEKLHHNIALLRKALFGSKSKKLGSDPNLSQLQLLETELSSRPVVEPVMS